MATTGASSSEWHRHSLFRRVARALASAFLEWLLIFFLFIDGVISYVITKFAGYCKLQTPCLFCSRLDHVLGKEKREHYRDLICSGHKSEISSLVLCPAHDKLVNLQGMCETCLLSYATGNKSNTETYRLLVGKLREESGSRFDHDPLIGEHTIEKCCSCCDEHWVLNSQKLAFAKSIGSGPDDFIASDAVENSFHEKRSSKQFASVRDVPLRNNHVDPLSRVGYTELKITSDSESESESEVPLSDDDGISIPVHGTDHTKEDIEVPCSQTEPCSVDLLEGLTSGKSKTSDAVGNSFYEKRSSKQFASVRDAPLRNNQVDPLSRVGYTELKITSDTESEFEVPLSDDDGISIPVHGADHTMEGIEVQCSHTEPSSVDLHEDLAAGKSKTSASVLEPLLANSGMQLENTDISGNKSSAAITERGNGLAEHDWQQVEKSDVCPSSSEHISCNDVPTSSNKFGILLEVSKENYDSTTVEVGLTSEQRPTMDGAEIVESGSKLTTSEAGLEPTPVSSDIAPQNPVLLDLGDAYKLAVSNRGRQLSGMLAEVWTGKDSTRVSEDLKILLSQFSATRGSDLPFYDISPRLSMNISPRLSINSDELKASDVSNSAGMQMLQKMISLERNESGLSLDGSIVSEIDGESSVDRLKRQLDHDRKLMNALYKELEEERNASAVAASQALAMITRLQEEKAALHMEALQYLRVMDEESEYETEALQKANNLLAEKEKEIEDLEAKLEFYRKEFPDESVLENMVETNSEMTLKDIGLDHSQFTCIENDGSVIGKSVTENPNISEKNVQSIKNSPLEFQDEKQYISQCLEKLEKQVYFFLNIHQSRDKWLNSENVEKVSPENSEESDNNLLMHDSVSSSKSNSDAVSDDPSSKSPPVCQQNDKLEYDGRGNIDLTSAGSLVSDCIGRLQVLEEDQSFIEHTLNLLSEGDKGLKLLQEIADHLQQLRKIGMREIDQPVA